MNSSQVWINAGYTLFGQEGYDGLQVERLARIINLNKSGFYHYFGERAVYFQHLMLHHREQVDQLVRDIEVIDRFDPDFLNLMTSHPETILVNIQLLRNQQDKLFGLAFDEAHDKIDSALRPLWANHLGIPDSRVGMTYFKFIRDAMYARITPDRLNYLFLHEIAETAKMIFGEVTREEQPLNN